MLPAHAVGQDGLLAAPGGGEHRWVAAPVLQSGDTLALYSDTGGGTNMM